MIDSKVQSGIFFSMKILVVGSGGREHALAWRISSDSSSPSVFCAPGNAGTAGNAVNIPINSDDLQGILDWALQNKPDLVVIGPEAPLCLGLADRLTAEGFAVFGPTADGARLEGSKVFSKEIMIKAGVPTAVAMSFTESLPAIEYLEKCRFPVVVKADGLAAGKGVIICSNRGEAENAVRDIVDDRVFGDAGNTVIIEDFLEGEEASILALTDGNNVVMLESAQDHKRIFNNDEGPNTGGMGAYSPAPVVTEGLKKQIMETILVPVVKELKSRGIIYRGVLYAGLMMTGNGPMVLEFNCRFGDPETQAILPRIDGDIVPALMACARGGLNDSLIKWKKDACVCVVVSSGGYPGKYEKGKALTGLESAESDGCKVFHAGTKTLDGNIVTDGGRVLGVTALGATLEDAVEKVYKSASMISFEGMHYRTDIAAKALRRNGL